MVLECVEGLGVAFKVEFGFPVVTACVFLVCYTRCFCRVSVCGGVGVREGARFCCGLGAPWCSV